MDFLPEGPIFSEMPLPNDNCSADFDWCNDNSVFVFVLSVETFSVSNSGIFWWSFSEVDSADPKASPVFLLMEMAECSESNVAASSAENSGSWSRLPPP